MTRVRGSSQFMNARKRAVLKRRLSSEVVRYLEDKKSSGRVSAVDSQRARRDHSERTQTARFRCN